jgi:Zn-dependent peptidase ImmA (M78 family)
VDNRRLSAKKILDEFGISSPDEIDITAIAQHFGATVVTEPLHGSVARILGLGERAFITVDSQSVPARQRFSAAHELGHWMMDRGKLSGFTCTEKQLVTGWSGDNPERRANRFAADLLMPTYLFAPAAKDKEITFATVRELCHSFETSITATAIRLVEAGSFPAMVVCSTSAGIKWKSRPRDLSSAIELRDRPGKYTNAAELLLRRQPEANPVEVEASDWLATPGSERYSIIEDSRVIYEDTVLSLIWWKDEKQLMDLDAEEEEQ